MENYTERLAAEKKQKAIRFGLFIVYPLIIWFLVSKYFKDDLPIFIQENLSILNWALLFLATLIIIWHGKKEEKIWKNTRLWVYLIIAVAFLLLQL